MSAQVTITQLPQAGTITGSEAVPIVQNGQTVQTTTGAIAASPSQTQTFLTLNQEPTLPNSRYLSSSNGIGLTDGGAQAQLNVTLNGVSGSLETSSNGIIAKTGGSVTGRTFQTSGSGLSISNADGVSGNPTFQLTGIAASIAALSGTGMLALTGGGTSVSGRTMLGTTNQINLVNGNGASGSPTFSLADNVVLPGTEGVTIPIGTTAQRPFPATNGELRYNTTTATFEGYANGAWGAITTGTGVTSVGLVLPSDFTVTNSPVTSTGDLTATWASQSANRVLASPNGSSGSPSFRSLANADLPASGVTANTYGSTTSIPVITVNSKGIVTSVTTAGIVGGLDYKGSWNASTNTPTLTSGVGTNGNYYVVSVAGTTNLDGITDWQVGDWAIFNGTTWQKIDQTNTVSSVNGQTGAVVLGYADVGAPSTSGTNATGTWAISISGNANTATSATSATSATTATNVAGGAANKIVYNTASGTTSFIDAPVTSGHYLKWNGTSFEWNVAGTGTVTSVDVSGGTTGLTTSGGPVTSSGTITLAGTLATTNGGTGLTSYTAGDLPYYATGTALSKLGIGTSTYMLTSSGSAPQWTDPASVTVGNATNATNSTNATNATNVATTATSTNADFYIPFVPLSTTGNQALGVDAGITYNPSTNAITAGISGGTF